jgi:hypothetical protein
LSAVEVLIRRARRRSIVNILLDQAILGACAAIAGIILVLVAGTDLLSWRSIAAVTAAGVAAAAVRMYRRLPDPYSVAQSIDRRLGLHDSLSTAVFFSSGFSSGRRKAPEAIRHIQADAASALAAGVRLEQAVPYTAPRSLYAMAALGLVASGLLAVRYGVLQRLDLRPPLPAMIVDLFRPSEEAKELAKAAMERPGQDELSQAGVSLDASGEPIRGSRDAAAALAAEADRAERAGAESHGEATVTREEQNQTNGGDSSGIAIPQADDDYQGSGEEEQGGDSGDASNGRQREGRNGENSSLMDKFRDALANLMSRMNPQQQGAGRQQSATAQQRPGQDQNREQQGNEGRQGRQGDWKGMPGAQGRGDSQQDGDQQSADSMQRGEGQDARESREARSGIGSNDGDKSVHEAEQLAAMGKISEILGKRSEALTGEISVEVTSGDQRLRTAYSSQSASHADAGGEISRDEIPLAYHSFVERYFEQVRKAPPPPQRSERGTKAVSE